MRLATLFSGVGAPEQAAKRVYGDSLELVFACEWDKFARQSFTANYSLSEEHFHRDINDLDGTQYKGKVDCIVGGSPCQDFSVAGLRAGIDGVRGQLIWEYYRIIKEVKPKYFIYENVKGMKSDKGGKTLADFLEVFEQLGYHCHHSVLNSKHYGVPQNRERIFIVGFLDETEHSMFKFAEKTELTKSIRDVLEESVEDKRYLSVRALKGYAKHKDRHEGRGNGFAFKPKEVDDVASCLTTRYGSRPTDTYIFDDTSSGKRVSEKIALPTYEDFVRGINTLTSDSQKVIRRLSPRECFRLQDFPDSFKFVVSDSQLYKQAGNSMTVAVVEMIFHQIVVAVGAAGSLTDGVKEN